MTERLLHTRWGKWVLFILGWAALTLLFTPEAYLYFYLRREPIPRRETFQLTLVNSGIALLFLPGIVWLTRRFPVERKTWPKALAVHIPACLLFSMGHSFLYWTTCYASNQLGETLFFRFHPNLLTYWAIVGFTEAVDYFERYTQRERELANAQLLLLKSQLHPHFLFNSLHTISAMMHEDVGAADQRYAGYICSLEGARLWAQVPAPCPGYRMAIGSLQGVGKFADWALGRVILSDTERLLLCGYFCGFSWAVPVLLRVVLVLSPTWTLRFVGEYRVIDRVCV